jgi:hypothetical protein
LRESSVAADGAWMPTFWFGLDVFDRQVESLNFFIRVLLLSNQQFLGFDHFKPKLLVEACAVGSH